MEERYAHKVLCKQDTKQLQIVEPRVGLLKLKRLENVNILKLTSNQVMFDKQDVQLGKSTSCFKEDIHTGKYR